MDQSEAKLTNPHWGKISELTRADVGFVNGSACCLSVETYVSIMVRLIISCLAASPYIEI